MIITDMKEHFVIDPLISKRQQLLLATQLCRMVLKVGPPSLHLILYTFQYTLHQTPSLVYSTSLRTPPPLLCPGPRFRGSGERCPDVTSDTISATNALCVVDMSRTDSHMHSIVPYLPSYVPGESLAVRFPPEISLTRCLQINNVIIAGGEDQEY